VYYFIFVIIELFSLALTVEALQLKTCQDSMLSGWGRSLGAKISGGRGRPWGIFLVSTKLDTFCYLTVLCIVRRAAVLTQYRRVRDGRSDGRNCRKTNEIYTLYLKNVPPLTCYNLNTQDLITITFERSVTEKLKNQSMLCFPTSPT